MYIFTSSNLLNRIKVLELELKTQFIFCELYLLLKLARDVQVDFCASKNEKSCVVFALIFFLIEKKRRKINASANRV